ncbi:MAG: hypothetical protein MK098_09910 [Marinovum sp.]|nr:hypothetical protein [Marinovum sp.]
MQINPFKSIAMSVISVGLMAAASPPASAQSLEISPIVLDIEDVDDDDLLVIAAYQPLAQPAILGTGRAERAALRIEEGQAQPSIILGRIAPGQEDAFGIEGLLPETVSQYGFTWDDLESRNALRESDPELFAKLVNGGHIDPPGDQLNRAIQTDLSRMNCYRSGIDGVWGNGSRRSVREYFDASESGASWPDQEPTNGLFRVIIINEDVRCVVATPAATNRSTGTTTNRATATSTTRSTSSGASSNSGSSSSGTTTNRRRATGTGVFR